jgi:hypothetical protein
MVNLDDARRAIDLEAQARRKRARGKGRPVPEMPADRLELAAMILRDFWQVADHYRLDARHYGRIGHMVKCALDVALAPRDEETRRAKRATMAARSAHKRRTWRSGERWDWRSGERAPGVEQAEPTTGLVQRWRDRPRPGMAATAPGGAKPRREPRPAGRSERRARQAERRAAWARSPDNARNRSRRIPGQ